MGLVVIMKKGGRRGAHSFSTPEKRVTVLPCTAGVHHGIHALLWYH